MRFLLLADIIIPPIFLPAANVAILLSIGFITAISVMIRRVAGWDDLADRAPCFARLRG
ncbi:hypothetical protein V461_13880 [Pantoea ananatis BRT98]|nr:hypothetical protein V461_13880 [Pantoea ananatis BRT98]